MYDVFWNDTGAIEQAVPASKLISENEQTHAHEASEKDDTK